MTAENSSTSIEQIRAELDGAVLRSERRNLAPVVAALLDVAEAAEKFVKFHRRGVGPNMVFFSEMADALGKIPQGEPE